MPRKQQSSHKPLTFPTQRPNEHVVLLLRRHWTILAMDIAQLVASLLLPPLILTFLFWYANLDLLPGSPLFLLIIIVISTYLLFTFLAYFHDFVDYHLDIWIVTDQRILSIEQQGLFNRVISELNILKVQDVTSEMKGKIQTFLDFGQVHIQTAGEKQRFIFGEVPKPSQVAKIILQVHDRAVRQYDLTHAQQVTEYGLNLQESGAEPSAPQQADQRRNGRSGL